MKVAVTTTSFAAYNDQPLQLLNEAGHEYILNPYGRKLSADELIELAADARGIISGTERMDSSVLRRLKALSVISRCGTGMDNVDLDAAQELGITVFNTPDAPSQAVAELTVGLMLDLLRKISLMNHNLHQGIWKKHMGHLLKGKKIGIIGFGRIGMKTAELLQPFGTELMYCDTQPKQPVICCGQKKFEEILAWADIISLHLSASSACCPLMGRRELMQMRQGSWLVNLSRGGVVDEEALFRALSSGHLAGAAVDVFETEPYAGQLRELPNVVLTPHIGSYARESRIAMELEAAQNVIKGLRQD